MIKDFMCHEPSGTSLSALRHYISEVFHGYFGKHMTTNQIPSDFLLSRISVPLTIHYSYADAMATAENSQKTISKLKSIVYVQVISGMDFNHFDFMLSVNAAPLIYSKILEHFENY